MNYIAWLWRGTRRFRVNIAIRVLLGTGRVALGLLVIWLSKRFIDETIRTGSSDDIVCMVLLLVATVVGAIILVLFLETINIFQKTVLKLYIILKQKCKMWIIQELKKRGLIYF